MKTRASTKEATQFQDTLWGQGEDKQVAYWAFNKTVRKVSTQGVSDLESEEGDSPKSEVRREECIH